MARPGEVDQHRNWRRWATTDEAKTANVPFRAKTAIQRSLCRDRCIDRIFDPPIEAIAAAWARS